LRAIGRQAPIAWGVDLRGNCAFPPPHIKPERLPGVSLAGAIQADRRGQARTLHVQDAEILSLAKTLGVLTFTPLTMLQACAQAVDFKVGHHFGQGQVRSF
jgi:hypothetical protein